MFEFSQKKDIFFYIFPWKILIIITKKKTAIPLLNV